jgi:NADPH:quinone reductase-like Zn-dependent oxidoreductase
MRAAVNTRYGPPDVIQVREVPKPAPGPHDVLVNIHATTVSRTDCGNLRAHPFFIRLLTGLARPKRTILGMDFAGEVEAVGVRVNTFAPGDRVFGLTPGGYGGHAEYLCLPETGAIAPLQRGLEYSEAVAGEGALYADTYLRAFKIKPGDRILVYGASGAIGTAAVQLAKFYGAEVTAVVGTRHVELARSLGADRVFDYTTGDFTRTGEMFNFVFDAVGKASYFRCRRLLGPEGRFAASDLGPWNQNLLILLWSALTRSKRFAFPLPKSTQAFVEFLSARMGAGEFRAVVDRTYPLEDIVAAYRYVETQQKTGIVVIEVAAVSRPTPLLP